jgi:peptide/nickel transport system substrate-binding protein
MRKVRARWKVGGALLVLALVATACGSSGGGGSTPKAADPDPAGILRLPADLTQPQSGQFDPVHVDVVLSTIHEYIYGTLLQLDASGKIQPGLAEKVDIIDSSNLVVTLKAGLKFTDGSVLDTDALKYSWERTVREAKTGGIEAEFREFDLLTVTSPTVMKVHLKTPIAGAFFRLMRLAESSPVSPTAVKAGVDFDKAPVGAGPFKFVSYSSGVSIKLTKNADYWNAKNVKLAGIEYVNVTPQALSNAVRSNTVDYAFLSTQQAGEVAGSPGFKITVKPSNAVMLQGLWCKNRPPFDNLKVRQAINYAIDRDAINAAVYNGAGEPSWGFNSSTSPYYDASLKDVFKYDVAKAKALLAEAGASALAFDMFYQPASDGQKAAEVMQQELLAVGVKVTLKPLTNATDFYPNATGAPINILPLSRVGIPKVTRVLVPPSFGNICAWNDPELNALVVKLQGVAETSAEGVALWKQISQNGIKNAVHLFGLFGTQSIGIDENRLAAVELYEGRTGIPTLDIEKVYVKK